MRGELEVNGSKYRINYGDDVPEERSIQLQRHRKRSYKRRRENQHSGRVFEQYNTKEELIGTKVKIRIYKTVIRSTMRQHKQEVALRLLGTTARG